MAAEVPENVYRDYLAALRGGNRLRCGQIAEGLLAQGLPPKALFMGLVERSMYEIGELWATQSLCAATEHMASAITEAVLNQIFPRLRSPRRVGRKAVVGALAPEMHVIGGRMVADLLEAGGWDSFFVGGNLPVEELLRFLEEARPDLLAMSLTMYSHLPGLDSAIGQIVGRFPDLPIVVGGQALRHLDGDKFSAHPQVVNLRSLDALQARLDLQLA